MAFYSKGSSAKEVNLSGSAGGSYIPAILERLEPGPENEKRQRYKFHCVFWSVL